MYFKNCISLYRKIIAFQFQGAKVYGIGMLLLMLVAAFIFGYQYFVFKIMRSYKIGNPVRYLVTFYYYDMILRALFQPTTSLNLKPYLIVNIPKHRLAKLFYRISYINLIHFIAVCFAVSLVVFGWDLLPGSQFAWLLSCFAFASITNTLFCMQKLFYPAFYNTILLVGIIGGLYHSLHKYSPAFLFFGNWASVVVLWILLIACSLFFHKQIIKRLYIE